MAKNQLPLKSYSLVNVMVLALQSLFQWFKKALTLLGFSALLCFVCLTLWPNSAQALMREIVEKPGQTLYQSRQSLKDEQGQTWQVVLFKRVKTDADEEINLRLVGFPGAVFFQHPAPLVIHSNGKETIELTDLLATENPGENVGQFLINSDFQNLKANGIWQLDLPLKSGDRQIKVPYFVLQEWQTLLAKS